MAIPEFQLDEDKQVIGGNDELLRKWILAAKAKYRFGNEALLERVKDKFPNIPQMGKETLRRFLDGTSGTSEGSTNLAKRAIWDYLRAKYPLLYPDENKAEPSKGANAEENKSPEIGAQKEESNKNTDGEDMEKSKRDIDDLLENIIDEKAIAAALVPSFISYPARLIIKYLVKRDLSKK